MRIAILLSAILIASCGPGIDRQATLTRLRAAMEAEIADANALEEDNRLVTDVSNGNVLEGMRQSEVEEALGRGQECGARPLCAEQGFEPTDWVYDVGRRDGLPAGPTLIVGFGQQGFVTGTYYLVRHGSNQPQ